MKVKNAQAKMGSMKEIIKEISQWKEEYSSSPNHPPRMDYLDKQHFIFSYEKYKEKYKERLEALEKNASNMVSINEEFIWL